MQFALSRPDIVRAISQRWLLKLWKRHTGADRLPSWKILEEENLSSMMAKVSFLDVVGTGETTRFKIRYNGPIIGRAYGSVDCAGKFLDETIPANRYADARKPYRRVVDSARPVYMVHDVTDRNGTLVHYERLLLPFADDGKTVNRILAAFEFICPDGNFEAQNLMKSPSAPPSLRLAATIEPQARPGLQA